MEHPPDPPAPDAAIYDAKSDLFFPLKEAHLFTLHGAKDALSAARQAATSLGGMPPGDSM